MARLALFLLLSSCSSLLSSNPSESAGEGPHLGNMVELVGQEDEERRCRWGGRVLDNLDDIVVNWMHRSCCESLFYLSDLLAFFGTSLENVRRAARRGGRSRRSIVFALDLVARVSSPYHGEYLSSN